MTRAAVPGSTRVELLMVRDTVAVETRARLATSRILMPRFIQRDCSSPPCAACRQQSTIGDRRCQLSNGRIINYFDETSEASCCSSPKGMASSKFSQVESDNYRFELCSIAFNWRNAVIS